MAPYQYATLDEGQFRILSLHPGTEDSPLEGDLLICPIGPYIDESKSHQDELPETEESYEAISYVWGSNDKPCVLSTPSGLVPITDSLHRCLKRVRLPNTKRRVWADAICINQNDNKEKETQIVLMRHIYLSAVRVLAYLGEEADESSAAIDVIERYWRYHIPQPANAGVRAFVEDLFRNTLPDADPKNSSFPPKDDPKWLPVSKFWNRPWFRRVWIAQEFVLARDVLIICGPKTVNWSQIWPATIALEQPEVPPWPLVDGRGKAVESSADLMANMAQRLRFYQLGAMRGNSRDHGHGDEHSEHAHSRSDDGEGEGGKEGEEEDVEAASDEESGQDEQEWESASEDDDDPKRSTDLLNLLLSFREVEATDPRDLYFGLLGLALDGDKPEFRPDYSAPFEAIALRFGKTLLHEPFSEELLDHSGLATNGTSFPSWLPDFRQPWRRMTVADAAESEAAGESDFDFGVDPDADDVLLLKGYRFDSIKEMSRIPRPAHLHADHPSLWVKRDMVTLEELINSTTGFSKQYPTKEPRLDAILRALTFFRTEAEESEIPISTLQLAWRYCIAVKEDNLDPERPERELLRKEIMFSGKVRTTREANEALEAATQIFLNRVYHTRHALDLVFCSTTGTYVAMVPEMCEAGDEIWILKGCNAPFVLRKSKERSGMFRIVGAAYVHGIMDGEGLEQKGFEFEPVSIY